MQGVDYEAWVTYVEKIIKHFRGQVYTVVDLACGTGSSTFPWISRGYKTVGVDISEEMLIKACQKAKKRNLDVTFLHQDLQNFNLGSPVDLAVCFQDGLNYILDPHELEQVFQAVFRNLSKNGFFIFDLNYPNRITSKNEEVSIVEEELFTLFWRTNFLESENLWTTEVAGFIKTQENYYEKFSEKHKEKVYEAYEVWPKLAQAGFTILGTYEAFTFDPPHERTLRIVFVAQKL